MEKLMSFFQSTEKRKSGKYEEEHADRSETPTPDDRRKWSISRSGRMKHVNKKRHSLSADHYGETCTVVEKPTSVEYHVNSPITNPTQKPAKPDAAEILPEPKSPEEEIESAFEILDKVDKAS